ncbi:related to KIC1-ser/thr protein kinase that interacts with Cdc31p [Ustilago bromivora]|uniref:Related to KIC1 - ser/thr protein kinase that interacts with Cdc31p n=1 Tax=Ustilago bromivora TaxID=307758 RepID=A0A1K0HDG0_9BASI|nr:related to KIC1-ser/thr protein kinase that interacts with Cdc31p [Ustilago bromivora]SYW78162.1 related to KIC1 - ser/thr protein kinase that interacts with Cdc31p [Ustilago bromivora]
MAIDVLRKVSGSSSHAALSFVAGANSAPASTSSNTSAPNSTRGASPNHTPRSSISRESSSKDKDVGRMTKMRAAMHIGSVYDDWPMYSANGDDYIVGDVIGFGASSVVHQGVFKPLDKACAIKVIDLEAYGRDTEELRRETQLMSLSKHPNVLRVRGCWVKGAKLHIATRLMSSGSMLDIMRFAHPEGFDETVIATVLKQALEGLNYLHVNGWLHRDLKAANILVDDDGTVLLGDFGVGVFVGDTDKSSGTVSSEGKRKSFVGTPCWMAPEVIERKHYGTKADIWSFGITALELSQGRAPNSKLNPVKVLMRTMQDEPPQLDRTGGAHKYSKLMDDFVRQCLQKDPEKRPTADKLLSHGFFKQAKAPKYLISAILAGLPPLADRQERRRLASIHSTQHHLSWDFGTISSRTTTPNLEKFDPFRNFTGVVSLPSPHGSVRSTKLVSTDGQHVLATEEGDTSLMRGFSSYDDSPSKQGAAAGTGLQSSIGRRRRRSADALGHRKSVSFESTDAKVGAEGVNAFGAVVGGSSLAPIGEKVSPMLSPAQQPVGGEEPTKLRLSSDALTGTAPQQTETTPTKATEEPIASSRASNSTGSTESSSPKQRSVSSPTTATLAPKRSESDKVAMPAPTTPASQNMLQRTASRLRGEKDGSAAASASSKESKHHKRESVFGKLFKGASSTRKEGKV